MRFAAQGRIMRFGQIVTSTFVASALVATPVMANAAALEGSRASASTQGDEIGGKWGWGLPIAILVLIAVGAIVLSDDNENIPASP